jgi:hypothetical protein
MLPAASALPSPPDIDFRFLVIGAPLQFLQRTGEASVISGE